MSNGGQKATRTGNFFERFVKFTLEEHRYQESSNGRDLFKKRALIPSGTGYYAHGVNVGKTVYGGKRLADLFIVCKELFPNDLIIECKWQQVKGSVDEKYSHLVDNIKTTGVPTIIVIGGNGYKPEALKWLKQQVDGIVLIAVWTMEEFQIAVNNGLFGTGFTKSAVPTPKAHKVHKVDNHTYYERTLWE